MAARVTGLGLLPINAVGVAVPGDPRSDNIQCRLNGITFPIPRRGGPMCPPVRGCVMGMVTIKSYISVIGGKGRSADSFPRQKGIAWG